MAPAPEQKKIRGARVVPSEREREMRRARVGAALTPQVISSRLRMADAGRMAPWHDLLNEVRQSDGVIQSTLWTREMALLGCGWSVQATPAKGEKIAGEGAEEVAAFCQEILSDCIDFGRNIAHLSDANYKAYSVTELEWDVVDGYLVPIQAYAVQGRRFSIDPSLRLRWSDEGVIKGPDGEGIDVLKEYPGKFIAHAPRITGDVLTREGLGRALVWLTCWRKWAWRDWMLFGELYGKPWKVVKLDRTKAQQEDEAAAHDIADNATSSTAVMIFESIDLDLKWPEANSGASASPAPTILSAGEGEIALVVLGQKQTTADVKGGLGGKGDVREQVRKDIAAADDLAMSETLRRDLLTNLVRWNFGPKAPIPKMMFATDSETDVGGFLDSVSKGAKAGMRIPLRYVHDRSGMPKAIDGEEIAQAGSSPANEGKDEEADPKKPTDKDDEDDS